MTGNDHFQYPFNIWKAKLDERCKNLYGIDTDDMGWSDEELEHHRTQATSPKNMSKYLGSNFNLTRVEDISWGSQVGA